MDGTATSVFQVKCETNNELLFFSAIFQVDLSSVCCLNFSKAFSVKLKIGSV